ncbi:glycosyltransferase [Oerskovia sp. Root22]|uniref:glycosyltransferase n=1 Tax=Oerskovia sp. Root22 TaxID=1736494 RepID=UPI000B0D2491|nr:glycosyltransferase family 2 protein [Oerskovia sp. Root22]
MLELLINISILFSLLLGALFLGYVVTILIPFTRYRARDTGDPSAFDWHFVVPCRDEEIVIGQTIAYLRTNFPEAQVWVVDDDSDDATAHIATKQSTADSKVHLIQRRLPDARTGKAHALNHAWGVLREHFTENKQDFDRTVIAVIDADGRPSHNMLQVCAGKDLFSDPEVAAVQVEVRMSNRDVRDPYPGDDWFKNLLGRTFVRMQDIEFRGPISAIQMSRRYSRTVNVGGNGQLARASALDSIDSGEGPWRGSLLEDFELGLHLLLAGWRNAYTPDAWVDQEALYSLPRYLTQRARWAQGTMQCFRYLPQIWTNRRISNLGALEISYFLLQPWLQILGTVFYPIPVVLFAYNSLASPETVQEYLVNGGAILFIMYAVIGVGEFAVWGLLYRSKCEPQATELTAIGWGMSFLVYIYLVYAVVWKAFSQLITRQRGWAKTIRNAEQVTDDTLIARLQ